MNYNLNSGWGQFIPPAFLKGSAGKMFVVGKSAVAYRDMYSEIFSQADVEGKVRFAATVDAAIGMCTANAGDTIYVLPGHTETVTSTSIALDVAGVQVIGLGTGLNRPTFTFSTAAATITVSAANCGWKNMHHIANFADVAAAFTLGAAKDFCLEGNTFDETGADLNWFNIVVTGATANAADGLTVIGNKAYMADAAAKSFISVLGTMKRLTANYNVVLNGRTTDTAAFLTMADKAVTQAEIKWNSLVDIGGSTANATGQFLTGSSTACSGIVAYNTVNSLNTTSALFATAGTKFAYQENYVSGAADKQGTLHPAADNPA